MGQNVLGRKMAEVLLCSSQNLLMKGRSVDCSVSGDTNSYPIKKVSARLLRCKVNEEAFPT